ncbi:hypothetical protein [Pseudomonas sp.]|uniref:hypothetical protein n=1 Tax=Pseudomonas sp. TaxID=306 RepID=UPI002582DFD7|nr:hypothetical protein [Pseudomonas sp.]
MSSPFDWPQEVEDTRQVPVFDGSDPLEIVRSIPPWVPNSPVGELARPEWSPRLVIDYVLGASKESIMEEYGIMDHHYERIVRDVGFMGKVAALKKELEKDGATFGLKAKLQAEVLLDESFKMAMDKEVDPRVRAKLIGDTVRWAGFDKSGAAPDNTGGFSVTITLNGVKGGGDVIDGEYTDV